MGALYAITQGGMGNSARPRLVTLFTLTSKVKYITQEIKLLSHKTTD